MKQIVTGGVSSYRAVIFIQNSTSTVGAGLTGLTHASSGLTWYWYSDANGTSSSVTITGQTLGTWTSGGFVEIDSTNLPGFYEIGVPNAVISNAQSFAVMQLFGATNMVPVNVEYMIALVSFRNSTTLGLSSLPFATAGSSGGLLLYGTGSGEINPANGTVTATVPSLSTNVNVQEWLGTAVTSNAGVPVVYTTGGTINVVTGTVTATVPGAGGTNVNVVEWLGTAVTSNVGIPVVYSTNTVTAVVASGTVTTVSGNVVGSVGSVVGTVTATVPTEVSANVTEWLGTAVTSNAGVPVVYTTNTVTSVVASGTVTTVTGNVGGSVASVVGTVTATVPTLSTNVNVVEWLGTAVTSNAGVPDVYAVNTVTAIVSGGTIATVTNPVSIASGQLTIKRDQGLNGFSFPMYNATTGALQTGLSVSAVVSIDGGSPSSTTNSPSEIGSGLYSLNLAAADTDGTVLTFIFSATGAASSVITAVTQA